MCASEFSQQSTIRCFGRLRSLCKSKCSGRVGQKKQKTPNNIFKIEDSAIFQIQVANGQLEKQTATTTLNLDNADNTNDEYFVVIKKLTDPIIGLHFMRNNSVVIERTHGLSHLPHLTMQIKTTPEMTAKPQVVLIDDALTIPPRTKKTITAFVDHASEWNTTIQQIL